MTTMFQNALVVAACLCGTIAGNATVQIGKPAPDFTAIDSSGMARSLRECAGKIVVLEWINHGCPYVKRHYESGSMQALQARLTSEGVVWLSICSSSPGEQGHASPDGWNSLIASKGMRSTAVLIDESGSVGRLYGAKTTPHMYVITADGTLAYNGAIDDNPSSRRGDASKTTNYVAAAVESIRAGAPVAVSTSRPYGCNVKY